MNFQQGAFGLPTDFREWILLGYILTVVAGAWVLGQLGRAHFRRAQEYAEAGFEYDAELDYYRCPEGERLSLHIIEPGGRVAVYRAAASSCDGCSRKDSCTPHDGGRHLYRPLATWAESDSGRFHQWVAVVMNGGATAVGAVAAIWWAGKPGTGLVLIASMLAAASFVTGLCARAEQFEKKK